MNRCVKAALGVLLLSPLLSGCLGADFSPDGQTLAVTWDTGQRQGLALLDVERKSLRFVPGAQGAMLGPSWSPDGRFILFMGQRSGHFEMPPQSLRIYDRTTRTTRELAQGTGRPWAWREDGERFAAVHRPRGDREEVVWYKPTGELTFRVPLPVTAERIVWLPGTDNIALLGGDPPLPGADVYLVESGEVRRVSTTQDVVGIGLSEAVKGLVWARSPTSLTWPPRAKAALTDRLLSVVASDRLGKTIRRLLFSAHVVDLNPDPGFSLEAVEEVLFSPDGSHLVLRADFRGEAHARGASGRYWAWYLANLDGTTLRLARKTRRVTGSVAISFDVVWSRDGSRFVVYELLDENADSRDVQISMTLYSAVGGSPRTLLARTMHR